MCFYRKTFRDFKELERTFSRKRPLYRRCFAFLQPAGPGRKVTQGVCSHVASSAAGECFAGNNLWPPGYQKENWDKKRGSGAVWPLKLASALWKLGERVPTVGSKQPFRNSRIFEIHRVNFTGPSGRRSVCTSLFYILARAAFAPTTHT